MKTSRCKFFMQGLILAINPAKWLELLYTACLYPFHLFRNLSSDWYSEKDSIGWKRFKLCVLAITNIIYYLVALPLFALQYVNSPISHRLSKYSEEYKTALKILSFLLFAGLLVGLTILFPPILAPILGAIHVFGIGASIKGAILATGAFIKSCLSFLHITAAISNFKLGFTTFLCASAIFDGIKNIFSREKSSKELLSENSSTFFKSSYSNKKNSINKNNALSQYFNNQSNNFTHIDKDGLIKITVDYKT